MITGNTNKESLLRVLNQIDIHSLISKMYNIYKEKMAQRINIIFQESHCTHERCSVTECHYKLLTKHDLTLIRTGFNIFRILTHFKEISPHHPSLDTFENVVKFDKVKFSELKKSYEKYIKDVKRNLGFYFIFFFFF